MTNKKLDPNEPAFATAAENGYTPGLTKREHFTAMAMQGLLSNSEYMSGIFSCSCDYGAEVSAMSLEMAGAAIAELNKEVSQ